MRASRSQFHLVVAGATLLVGCAQSEQASFGESDSGVGGSSVGGASTGGFGGGVATGGSSTGGAGGSTGGVGGSSGGVGGSSGGVGGSSGGTGGSTGGAGGSGGTSTNGDCCTPHNTPGCTNKSIESCVCAKDAFCCNSRWDEGCVSEVKTVGCGNCGTGGTGGSGGAGGSGGTGGTGGSGGFGATGGFGGGTGGGPAGDCCFVHTTPSCSNSAIAACVCAADSYCCQYDWDSICVSEVTSEGCGTC